MADPNPDNVEISRADYNILKASYETLNGLWSSPKHGVTIKKAVKEMRPETSIPELDIAERYAEPLRKEVEDAKGETKKLREEIEAREKTRADKEALDGIYAKIDGYVKKKNMTEDGRAGLIKLMQERQIADVEAAGALYMESLPKPKPAASSGGAAFLPQGMNEFGTRDEKGGEFEDFWKDPIAAQDKMIAQIINEDASAA